LPLLFCLTFGVTFGESFHPPSPPLGIQTHFSPKKGYGIPRVRRGRGFVGPLLTVFDSAMAAAFTRNPCLGPVEECGLYVGKKRRWLPRLPVWAVRIVLGCVCVFLVRRFVFLRQPPEQSIIITRADLFQFQQEQSAAVASAQRFLAKIDAVASTSQDSHRAAIGQDHARQNTIEQNSPLHLEKQISPRGTAGHSPRDECVVTLCLQTSFDRIHRVQQALVHYDGPISVAVSIYSDHQAEQTALWAREAANAANRTVGILTGNSTVPTTATLVVTMVQLDGPAFPINILRNAAVQSAWTSHVLTLDVDFATSVGICSHLSAQLYFNDHDATALVIPAFETSKRTADGLRSFEDLLGHLMTQTVVTAHRHFVVAHAATKYEDWMQATVQAMMSAVLKPGKTLAENSPPYVAQYEYFWEPYYVVPKAYSVPCSTCDGHATSVKLPPYPEDFTSYGNDKAAHAYELAEAGYTFKVTLGAFAVHLCHEPGKWKAKTTEDVNNIWVQWWGFTEHIRDKYRKSKVRNTPLWLREYLPHSYPERPACKVCDGILESDIGRCGPHFGKAFCGGRKDAIWCNEESGWCGNTTAHRDAQQSNLYDADKIPGNCCVKLGYGTWAVRNATNFAGQLKEVFKASAADLSLTQSQFEVRCED